MSICQNLFNLWCLGLWVHFTSAVQIIPKSARLLNPEGCLIDATGYAPGLPFPKRPIPVMAQNLGGIRSVLIQVLFSLPICLLQGGVAKSYEGMKTPIC